MNPNELLLMSPSFHLLDVPVSYRFILIMKTDKCKRRGISFPLKSFLTEDLIDGYGKRKMDNDREKDPDEKRRNL